ncbi:MAG: hypothetical protein LBS05_04260 [Tannerellaceae bacterium]|jgi:hypothetical protein|nr:hypothetical protein [Tannerellaceae bacterium]
MDNLGDWLYIVLLVIAGISGLLSSGKKKKQPEEVWQQPEPETPEYSEWDSSPWDPAPQPAPPAPLPRRAEQPIKTKQAYVSLFQEGERNVANRQTENPPQEIPPLISAENLRDADELKKAILYSEIFNRKY